MNRYEYIYFVHIPRKTKTHVWGCYSNSSNAELGFVKWHGPWRQYCFFPMAETVFNNTCMADITAFEKNEGEERR